MLVPLPAMLMRGGTSRGLYLLRRDVDALGMPLDDVLPAVMGSPAPLQVDGVGGAASTTSKVAIVGRSARPDTDVDFLFGQVDVASARVDWTPTCGNLLAGIGQFALERALVVADDGSTVVRVHLVNTGADVEVTVATPGGMVEYGGDTAIAGVPGTAAPVEVTMTGFVGGATGSLLPTGRAVDVVDGVPVSCVDAAVCAVLVRARDLGLRGDETPAEIDADRDLLARLERIRRRIGVLAGLGDVSGAVVPKILLISPTPRATVRSRYLVPHRCHPAHAVSGAVCLASAIATPGTVAVDVAARGIDGPVVVEHPAGELPVTLECTAGRPARATVVRTARKLFDGAIYVPVHRPESHTRAAGPPEGMAA